MKTLYILLFTCVVAYGGIHEDCKAKWGAKYTEVKHCELIQNQAKDSLSLLNSTLVEECRVKWKHDYSMIKHCAEEQAANF